MTGRKAEEKESKAIVDFIEAMTLLKQWNISLMQD